MFLEEVEEAWRTLCRKFTQVTGNVSAFPRWFPKSVRVVETQVLQTRQEAESAVWSRADGGHC